MTALDFIALFIFIGSWVGYTQFARIKAKTTPCLSRCLHQHRILWMRHIFDHDIRVSDAAMIANLDRHVAFFASSTMLVLAGVLTLFTQVDNVSAMLSAIPYATDKSPILIQIKLSLLVLIFVLAFFQFTWSMRQYGFVNIMMGAAPFAEKTQNKNLIDYAKQMAVVQDQAGHAYNYGLRSYYFALAALCWFYHPVLFIISSLMVVYVLYYREFKSRALRAIKAGINNLEEDFSDLFPEVDIK
ncbi:DUF599 domain-containing protein [Thalassotalea mangrovi]|uniref:DUF599 domain-containing protein n=1 Tax=Thalassotalea mangrovi TaxID=2572245 RepID=A0A4U1B6I1_9GAMM|nr:DUF599 domain-containing protein [Thalassotalea mangrovi]TKB45762.1 DUF599 domain-containing protein [Thalassotalea mangrovi]